MTKSISKPLIFSILDILQLKTFMILKILQCKSFVLRSGYIEEKNGNKYLVFDDSVNGNKMSLKHMQMFGMELKTKSKP